MGINISRLTPYSLTIMLKAANAVSLRKEHARDKAAERTVDLFLVPHLVYILTRVLRTSSEP